jgi:hypothetical protein
MSPKIKISKKGGTSNSEGKPTQDSCSNKQFNQIIDISVPEDRKKLERIIKIPKSTDKGGYFINPHYSINKTSNGNLEIVYQCQGILLRIFLKENVKTQKLSFYIYGLLNIANGIVELEKQGFVHNNISIDNILVTDKPVEYIQNKILLINLSGVLEDNQLDKDAIALGKVILEILEVYTIVEEEDTMRKSSDPEIKHQINIHTKLTQLVSELHESPPKNATRSILLAEGLDSIKRFDVAFWENSQKPTNSTTPEEGGRSATKKAKQPPTKSATKPSTKKATKQSTKQAKLPVKRPSKIVSK